MGPAQAAKADRLTVLFTPGHPQLCSASQASGKPEGVSLVLSLTHVLSLSSFSRDFQAPKGKKVSDAGGCPGYGRLKKEAQKPAFKLQSQGVTLGRSHPLLGLQFLHL